MIFQDLERYTKNRGISSALKMFFNHPGFRFMVMHRICNRFSSFHPVGTMGRLWHKRLRVKYGFQIPHKTSIRTGLFLGHYGGIVINQNATIGYHCNIAQGVTIGQINRGEKKGCPTLGDRVWVGPNAVIVGNITIGDDVLIAPLAYVNFDIPAKSVVMGNPAKIVSGDGSQGYVN